MPSQKNSGCSTSKSNQEGRSRSRRRVQEHGRLFDEAGKVAPKNGEPSRDELPPSRNGNGAGGTVYSPVYERKPFTAFHTVTPATKLEDLNLNWREQDLPERERTKHVHRLHPYLGKFIPQLVEIFLRKYFAPGMTVADPFAGSGTTLVQANELNIHSIGYDISAFNVLLMKAKTAVYDIALVKREFSDAISRARALLDSAQTRSLFEEEIAHMDAPNSEYLRNWFAEKALQELLAFRTAVLSGRYECADLMKVVLSRSARSARLTTHFDLDFPKEPVAGPYYCHKHRRICEPTQEAFKFIVRYTKDTLRRVAEFQQIRTQANVRVVHADSRRCRIPEIDGVFTSPPYVGLIDYHEQHSYAYHLLGLKDRRAAEIGAASAGSSAKARQKYMEDIAVVFDRFLRKMPKGGPLIVVAGDRHNLYPTIAEMLNVEVEGVIERHVNRRTGRRSTPFYESVFVWRKR
ncbi:MAG: restriction endonuclease subunit M [Fimbriimonadales bacterium]|nr:MAG: restriction endonuclease subunit M [Fimbriimonadales bacterium]